MSGANQGRGRILGITLTLIRKKSNTKHDRGKFRESNDILNEAKLEDFTVQLDAHEYYEYQAMNAREFIKFFHYESNKYINTNISNLCSVFCDSLENLCDFIESYRIDEGRYYMIDPHDRFYAEAEDYDKPHPEWDKFDKEFSQLRESTKREYKTYRAAVRETLLI